MSSNDKNLQDLQEIIDDLNGDLERALSREFMAKAHCQELKKELAMLKVKFRGATRLNGQSK